MKRIVILASAALLLLSCGPRAQEWTTVVKPLDGECWWGAVVNKGYGQPYTDFGAGDNFYLDDNLDPDYDPRADVRPFDHQGTGTSDPATPSGPS